VTYRRALAEGELWPGEMLGLVIDGVKVLLVNLDGTIHAFEDRCAHQAALLSKGRLEGNVLTCGVHHWCYDVRTGTGVNPESARLRRLTTKLENGEIFVDVSDGRTSQSA
jgi:toluene monooxygenase system ferredoxin subunit